MRARLALKFVAVVVGLLALAVAVFLPHTVVRCESPAPQGTSFVPCEGFTPHFNARVGLRIGVGLGGVAVALTLFWLGDRRRKSEVAAPASGERGISPENDGD